jgi:hypothetical protein
MLDYVRGSGFPGRSGRIRQGRRCFNPIFHDAVCEHNVAYALTGSFGSAFLPMVTFLALKLSLFGIHSLRTPAESSAFALSGSAPSGSVKDRMNAPWRRSQAGVVPVPVVVLLPAPTTDRDAIAGVGDVEILFLHSREVCAEQEPVGLLTDLEVRNEARSLRDLGEQGFVFVPANHQLRSPFDVYGLRGRTTTECMHGPYAALCPSSGSQWS